MKKKTIKSDLNKLDAMKDCNIDYSDIGELDLSFSDRDLEIVFDAFLSPPEPNKAALRAVQRYKTLTAIPNKKTLEAMEEVASGKTKRFKNSEDFFNDLEDDKDGISK